MSANPHRKTTTYLINAVLFVCFCLSFTSVQAEDEVITIEGTRIRGNQESPTILYLVPWQAPEVVALDAPAASLAIERALKPLERSEFKRLISYHQHFQRVSDREQLNEQSSPVIPKENRP